MIGFGPRRRGKGCLGRSLGSSARLVVFPGAFYFGMLE